MPEGPSIVILKEQALSFVGKEVVKAAGNSKTTNVKVCENKVLVDIKSWGKHFLLCFEDFTIKIHFLLFGTYRINQEKETPPRLSLLFNDGSKLNFYGCSILLIEESLDELYDWSADAMGVGWDANKAYKKVTQYPQALICDILLDQNIFSGVGNIIKNEVLFRCMVHPESRVEKIPAKVLKLVIEETRNYCFQFLEWKKEFTLKKHWLAHDKKICSRDQMPLAKQYLGKTNRRTFYCAKCQKVYA